MRLYIVLPGGASGVFDQRFTPARISYRVRGARLYRARDAGRDHGGIMVLSISGYTGGGPASALLDEIESEISARGFEGVVLDSGESSSALHASLAGRLASDIAPYPVFVPEALGSNAPRTFVLIQTALSGGNLVRRLSDAAERFGADRLALECDRLRMEFRLPCPEGAGAELDAGRFDELRERAKLAFFSDALCVNYFYRGDGDSRSVVLFDDAESMRKKLNAAEALGISSAFLFYPRMRDILHEL
ncbi:MAG: hypothetical protein LBK23_08840 [Oscillospiraceae bacterium]|jgi:hypothetical protein|nr:hypothetical protein [Oscillospiraceae bacterium]